MLADGFIIESDFDDFAILPYNSGEMYYTILNINNLHYEIISL